MIIFVFNLGEVGWWTPFVIFVKGGFDIGGERQIDLLVDGGGHPPKGKYTLLVNSHSWREKGKQKSKYGNHKGEKRLKDK